MADIELVIRMPESIWVAIQNGEYCGILDDRTYNAVKNGVPLDDVKLKIEQDMSFDMFNDYGNETAIHKELWEILDNIGKENDT